MMRQAASLDLLDVDFPEGERVVEHAVEDRGSRYAACARQVHTRSEVQEFIRTIRADTRFSGATHYSFAVRVSKEGVLYEVSKDDGETGAGNVILREIQAAQYKNVCVCVVRWFGGTLLGVDRYAHIQTAARSVLL